MTSGIPEAGASDDLDDACNTAVFVAPDQARMMTAATVDISGGAIIN
ncbi:hypothetical protein [Nonomuraea sp. SYSU D8015]|nr:hypothetical protein [Nonomuraea sp. SYSU D8015]